MKRLVVLASATMGNGSDELGATLLPNFLRKLWLHPTKPDAVVFYNGGVLLLADGHPAGDALAGLAEAGVDLVACGTCLAHFGVTLSPGCGRLSDMQEIVQLMMGADSLIRV